LINYKKVVCFTFIAIVLVRLVYFFFHFEEEVYNLKRTKFEYTVAKPNRSKLPINFEQLFNYLKNHQPKSLKDTVSIITDFVNHYSIHLIDEEHGHYATNTDMVLNQMVEFGLKGIGKKPHLSCGPRAMVLQKILTQLKLKSRIVQLYTDAFNDVQSHTFLEIYSEKDNDWFISDPDFNVTYIRQNGKSCNSINMVFSNSMDEFIPIGFFGQKGWSINHINHLRDNYFKSVRIGNMVFINKRKFNMNKHFELNSNMDGIAYFDSMNLNWIAPENF